MHDCALSVDAVLRRIGGRTPSPAARSVRCGGGSAFATVQPFDKRSVERSARRPMMILMDPITVGDLQRALLAARARTNNLTLSQQVQQGCFRLVRIVTVGRKTAVRPLSSWVDARQHLRNLECVA